MSKVKPRVRGPPRRGDNIDGAISNAIQLLKRHDGVLDVLQDMRRDGGAKVPIWIFQGVSVAETYVIRAAHPLTLNIHVHIAPKSWPENARADRASLGPCAHV